MMSDQRILQLEKELASMQATVNPLVAEIKESTGAMTNLANKISLLVQSNTYMQKSFDEIKSTATDNTKRITHLETAEEVRKSGDAVVMWIKRTVVVALVVGVLSLVIVK